MNLLHDNHYDVMEMQRQKKTGLQLADSTDVNVTTDFGDVAKNKIYSIHFNLEFCCNFKEFEKLMEGHYYDVDLT